MATGQDLRHDFAPAWLKLPNGETKQHVSVKLGERSLDRSVNERSARSGWYPASGGSGRASRAGQDDLGISQQSRRQRFYSTDYPAEYNGSFNGDVQRSNLRHGGGGYGGGRFHDQVNGFVADGFGGNGPRSPALNGAYTPLNKYHSDGVRPASLSDMPTSSRGRRTRPRDDVGGGGGAHTSLDDEFPSLNGDSPVNGRKPATNRVLTVWDSPCREPTNVSGRSLSTLSQSDSSHKALVLKAKREGPSSAMRSPSSATSPLAQKTVSASTTASSARDSPKESVVGGVLSTCLVKQPKNLGDKKSSFLKALRRCETREHEQDGQNDTQQHSTPANSHDQTVAESCSTLSDNANVNSTEPPGRCEDVNVDSATTGDVIHPGFTEAEYRLLLEMGWQEPAEDEDGYEITEDDVREFEDLCRQLKNNELNGLSVPRVGNGIGCKSLSNLSTSSATITSHLFTHIPEVPLPCLDDDDSSSDTDIDPH